MCPKGYVNMEMSIIIYYAVRVNKLVPCGAMPRLYEWRFRNLENRIKNRI